MFTSLNTSLLSVTINGPYLRTQWESSVKQWLSRYDMNNKQLVNNLVIETKFQIFFVSVLNGYGNCDIFGSFNKENSKLQLYFRIRAFDKIILTKYKTTERHLHVADSPFCEW